MADLALPWQSDELPWLNGSDLPWLNSSSTTSTDWTPPWQSADGGIWNTVGDIAKGVESVAGPLLSAGSTYLGGEAALQTAKGTALDYRSRADSYDFQAAISLKNASIALMNKEYERKAMIANLDASTTKGYRERGAAKAIYGAQGVVLGSGSTSDVFADMKTNTLLNNAIITFESQQKQRGYDSQREVLMMEAENYKRSATNLRKIADMVIESGEDSKKATDVVAGYQAVKSIPDVISGVGQVINAGGKAWDLITSVFDF